MDQKYKHLLLAIAGGERLPEFFQPKVEQINEKFKDRFAIPVEITINYGWHRFALLILGMLLLLALPVLLLYTWLRSARYAVAVNEADPINIFVSPLRKYPVSAPNGVDERKPRRLGVIKMGLLRNPLFETAPEVSIAGSKRRTAGLISRGSRLDLEFKLPRPDSNGRQRFNYALKFSKADRRGGKAAGKTQVTSGKYD